MRDDNIKSYPDTEFIESIIRLNRLQLENFQNLVFFPGMLFGSIETWWGKGGRRQNRHEGIDICLYLTKHERLSKLEENDKLPVLYPGRVEAVAKDFLAKTILVSHDLLDKGGRRLYSFYAHVDPVEHIVPGRSVKENEVIASISPGKEKTPMLPHLHLSVAWTFENFNPLEFDWKNIYDDKLDLCDPLEFISTDFQVIPFTPGK